MEYQTVFSLEGERFEVAPSIAFDLTRNKGWKSAPDLTTADPVEDHSIPTPTETTPTKKRAKADLDDSSETAQADIADLPKDDR